MSKQTAVQWLIDKFTSTPKPIYNSDIDSLFNTALQMEREQMAYQWVKYDHNDTDFRPQEYGKYLVCRKDGKIHWETWNGSGWAYNHNEIRYFAVITNPVNQSNKDSNEKN